MQSAMGAEDGAREGGFTRVRATAASAVWQGADQAKPLAGIGRYALRSCFLF
jgi:hypothetical protein